MGRDTPTVLTNPYLNSVCRLGVECVGTYIAELAGAQGEPGCLRVLAVVGKRRKLNAFLFEVRVPVEGQDERAEEAQLE